MSEAVREEVRPGDVLEVAVEGIAEPHEKPPGRVRLTGVVAGLSAANALNAALTFITAPLLARALGASGRGDLAAIAVPLALIPIVLSLGIPRFANRMVPRGTPVNEVIGSLGVPLLIVGALAAGAAVPAADALSGGRETVRLYLIITFLAMPMLLVGTLLLECLVGLARWRRLIVAQFIPFGVPLVGILVLYPLHRLTVGTAAALIIVGTLLAIVPALPLLAAGGRPVFRLKLATEGVRFGLKSWLGGLAQLGNLRLDQFLMIAVVTPRELGLYAVATNLSGASTIVAGALTPPLMTRVAAGETDLLPRAVRIILASTVAFNVLLGLASPILISGLLGPQFAGAVPMTIVLLIATVPLVAAGVLSSGLQADGAPMIPSIAELVALVITVVGLVILLPPLGGMGAAIVSLAAYSASFVLQLVMARRRRPVPLRTYLVPTREDLRWGADLAAGVIGRLRVAIR
jgi:O-antigen/teichoic acid export membrane protein